MTVLLGLPWFVFIKMLSQGQESHSSYYRAFKDVCLLQLFILPIGRFRKIDKVLLYTKMSAAPKVPILERNIDFCSLDYYNSVKF